MRTTEAGGSINLLDSDKESFITNDQSVKYVYASDNAAGQTVASDGSTIVIVKFNSYNKIDYNVKAVDGAGNDLAESIASVSGYSDQSLELFWSKYVKIGNTWYVADAPFYQGNITETGEKSVTYTVSDIDYFIECENMIGVRPDRWVLEYSSNNSGYKKIRQNSYYRTIYTANLEEGGLYDLELPYNNSNSSNSSHTIQTRASNGDVTDIAEWTTESGANKIYRLENINIPAGSSLALYYGGNGNSNARMDYLTLTKSSVNYIVKYMCGNTEIKTAVTHQAKWGIVPVLLDTDKEDVVTENVKYVYASDDAADVTVAADGSTVVTINFTEISKVNYSLKAMAGNTELATIIEGSDFPETVISYGYSQYLAKDGLLYQSNRQNSNPWWGKSFTLGTEDYQATVSYTATSTTGIVFCKEAEDIEGLTVISGGNTDIRASNRKGAYATANTTITTLAPGSYKIYGATYGNSGITFTIKAGDATVFTIATNGNPVHTAGEEFTLATATDIVLQAGGNGGNSPKMMDYIIIQKTVAEATLAVTAAKYGTFIAPFAVTLPNGVSAYTVEDNGSQLTMTEVQNSTVPANTPVVVSSEEVVSEVVTGRNVATGNSYQVGSLIGTYVDIDAPNGSYILQNQNGKVGFYRVDTSVAQPKVRANRAYLSSGSNARSSFLFEDSEVIDGINAVKALTEGEALIYDMNGVQQPRLKKGMNIIRTKDGRTQKVMVK